VYTPDAFRVTDPEAIHAIIREVGFGILVSTGEAGLTATHLPFVLETERGPHGVLLGHMARANPQWQELREESEVLVLFPGPHAYISPRWYATDPSVPTWNYVAVHAYGRPRLIDDEARVYQLLETLVGAYEGTADGAWEMASRRDYVAKLSRAIVAFEIEITRLEGKQKLSQNRSPADREGVVAALLQQGDDDSRDIAALMGGGE
jgi:transcriptional regulator